MMMKGEERRAIAIPKVQWNETRRGGEMKGKESQPSPATPQPLSFIAWSNELIAFSSPHEWKEPRGERNALTPLMEGNYQKNILGKSEGRREWFTFLRHLPQLHSLSYWFFALFLYPHHHRKLQSPSLAIRLFSTQVYASFLLLLFPYTISLKWGEHLGVMSRESKRLFVMSSEIQ